MFPEIRVTDLRIGMHY